MYHEKTIDNILNLPIPTSARSARISIPGSTIYFTRLKDRAKPLQTSEEMLVELENSFTGRLWTHERKIGEVYKRSFR